LLGFVCSLILFLLEFGIHLPFFKYKSSGFGIKSTDYEDNFNYGIEKFHGIRVIMKDSTPMKHINPININTILLPYWYLTLFSTKKYVPTLKMKLKMIISQML